MKLVSEKACNFFLSDNERYTCNDVEVLFTRKLEDIVNN